MGELLTVSFIVHVDVFVLPTEIRLFLSICRFNSARVKMGNKYTD